MAGVGGSLIYILFNAVLKLTNQESFLALLPTVIIFMMAYGQVLVEPTEEEQLEYRRQEEEKERSKGKGGKNSGSSTPSEELQEQAPLLVPTPTVQDALLLSSDRSRETKCQRYWRCTKLVAWQATNLFAVYFFEYVASVGAADRANPPGSQHSTDWFVRNSFVLLAFCYQAGVFISRSSLQIVRIRRVEILTLIQAANFVLWILQAYYKMMPIGAQLPMMVFVGLLGGASYVNIFYNLLHDPEYPEEDRELIVNMAAIMINMGIILASVFSLVMVQTFLQGK